MGLFWNYFSKKNCFIWTFCLVKVAKNIALSFKQKELFLYSFGDI